MQPVGRQNHMSNNLYIGGNGRVFAMDPATCAIRWSLELNPGWFVMGSPFVSLKETERHLFAFAYGTLYKIDKRDGSIVEKSEPIRELKHKPGVFSTTLDATMSSDVDAAIIGDGGDGGDGDGADGGDGDGGD